MGKSKSKPLPLSAKQDRLSNLPEPVLYQILSSLGIQEAFKTSILSRYWRSLFPPQVFHRFETFDSLLKQVFESRKSPEGLVIRKHLILYFENRRADPPPPPPPPYLLIPWIHGATECPAEELELELNVPWNQIEPSTIFNAQTITTLKLRGCMKFGYSRYSPPPLVSLPSLKVLDMKMALHNLDKLVPPLLSGCPVLEELSICGHYNQVKFCSPTLNKLSLTAEAYGDKRLEIDAPSLKYLVLSDQYPSKYAVTNLNNLIEASISMRVSQRNKRWFFYLFSKLSNVKSLYLNIYMIYGYGNAPHLQEGDVEDSTSKISNPCHRCCLQFRNLSHLRFGELSDLECLLTFFLQISVKLKALVIERRCFHSLLWTKPHEIPGCLSSSLAHFTYKGFEGTKEEFENVEYICRNSRVLKTLTIQPSISLTKKPQEERFQIYEELSRLPKGSKSCEFRFEQTPFYPDKG